MRLLNTPRVPLFIGASHVGSTLVTDIALCAAIADYYAIDQASRTKKLVLPSEQAHCNDLLAQWAQALHGAGRLKTWRNELLSIGALPDLGCVLDGLPTEIARLERGAARVLGILTHAVHLVGFSSTGKIWMQQRALNKSTDPGLWDTLSGGLLSAGDGLRSGVLRETHEEAGLLDSDLLSLNACGVEQQSRMVSDGHILEAVWTFTATLKEGATPHNLDGEAMGFACLYRNDLIDLIAAKQVTPEAVLALQKAHAI
jgi:8-oxo-dGTP pyrophosphatase MutT (NUDIX family)